MMKLLLGGSPCTHWSIAQTKNRETEPSGIGWELFKNYKIALEKFQPDYFLYENNKSMSAAIREQITQELGVEPICINSALVSAQNRQRLYWTNIPGVEQPKDRGILLRDILETEEAWREKAYELKANYAKAGVDAKTGLYAAPIMTVPEATKKGFCEIAPGECVDLAMEHSKTRRGRRMDVKSNCLTTSCAMYEYCGTIDRPLYQVKDCFTAITDKVCPMKLGNWC